jgi:hypothetical protein
MRRRMPYQPELGYVKGNVPSEKYADLINFWSNKALRLIYGGMDDLLKSVEVQNFWLDHPIGDYRAHTAGYAASMAAHYYNLMEKNKLNYAIGGMETVYKEFYAKYFQMLAMPPFKLKKKGVYNKPDNMILNPNLPHTALKENYYPTSYEWNKIEKAEKKIS